MKIIFKYIIKLKLIIVLGLFFNSTNLHTKNHPKLLMILESGSVTIETYPEKAPNHVKRIKELAESGFYDGLTFHRVIKGFMAQGGDPKGNGTGEVEKISMQSLTISNILEE